MNKEKNWIEKLKKEEDNKKIKELMENIEKNSIELGKILYEDQNNKSKYLDFMTKNKYNQLIKLYKFSLKYNIKNVKLTIINIILKHEKNIKEIEIKELLKDSINLTNKEIKEKINKLINKKEEIYFSKTFKFDSNMILLYKNIEDKLKNLYPDMKITNQTIMNALLIDFINNN